MAHTRQIVSVVCFSLLLALVGIINYIAKDGRGTDHARDMKALAANDTRRRTIVYDDILDGALKKFHKIKSIVSDSIPYDDAISDEYESDGTPLKEPAGRGNIYIGNVFQFHERYGGRRRNNASTGGRENSTVATDITYRKLNVTAESGGEFEITILESSSVTPRPGMYESAAVTTIPLDTSNTTYLDILITTPDHVGFVHNTTYVNIGFRPQDEMRPTENRPTATTLVTDIGRSVVTANNGSDRGEVAAVVRLAPPEVHSDEGSSPDQRTPSRVDDTHIGGGNNIERRLVVTAAGIVDKNETSGKVVTDVTSHSVSDQNRDVGSSATNRGQSEVATSTQVDDISRNGRNGTERNGNISDSVPSDNVVTPTGTVGVVGETKSTTGHEVAETSNVTESEQLGGDQGTVVTDVHKEQAVVDETSTESTEVVTLEGSDGHDAGSVSSEMNQNTSTEEQRSQAGTDVTTVADIVSTPAQVAKRSVRAADETRVIHRTIVTSNVAPVQVGVSGYKCDARITPNAIQLVPRNALSVLAALIERLKSKRTHEQACSSHALTQNHVFPIEGMFATETNAFSVSGPDGECCLYVFYGGRDVITSFDMLPQVDAEKEVSTEPNRPDLFSVAVYIDSREDATMLPIATRHSRMLFVLKRPTINMGIRNGGGRVYGAIQMWFNNTDDMLAEFDRLQRLLCLDWLASRDSAPITLAFTIELPVGGIIDTPTADVERIWKRHLMSTGMYSRIPVEMYLDRARGYYENKDFDSVTVHGFLTDGKTIARIIGGELKVLVDAPDDECAVRRERLVEVNTRNIVPK